MANYYCTIRTNYFHVKDPEAFRAGMENVHGSEDKIHFWEETDNAGNTVFGFGCYGRIAGMWDENAADFDEFDIDDDAAYGAFLDFLQANVADDDAILLMEAGNEKMCYVVGSVLIITKSVCVYRDIQDIGIDVARTMLLNPDFTTKTDY